MDLAAQFEALDENTWRTLAEKALKGRAIEDLSSTTLDHISLEPLYWSKDESANKRAGQPGREPFTRGLRANVGVPAWTICQLHAAADASETNKQILADLEGGVGAIALRIATPEQAGLLLQDVDQLDRALEGVHLDFIALDLEPGIHFSSIVQMLRELWSRRGLGDDAVSGSLGADPLGACAQAGGLETSFEEALAGPADLAILTHARYPGVTALSVDTRPYHDAGASEAQELACLAATLAAYLRALETAGLAPEDGLAQIGFVLTCDANLFISIAKLRAARALISAIARSCGAEATVPGLALRAETSRRMLSQRDSHVNLLRATAAAAGAVLGGADTISVLPFTALLGQPDDLARRIARNCQLVLREEAHLGRVLDAAGGSWFIDSLSEQLAAKAWALFQDIEAAGGMMAALASGDIQARLREAASARARQVATADAELIGINAFPQLHDKTPTPSQAPAEALDDPAVTVEPLPLARPAQAFEALRDAANAFAESQNALPQLFLANIGSLADYNARSLYTSNLFATGGIEAVGDAGYDTPQEVAAAFTASGAKIACICGSDEAYDENAAAFGQALQQAGAQYIYLAGRPGKAREAFKKAGIAHFIHKGCDQIDVLRQAHDTLGVDPQ